MVQIAASLMLLSGAGLLVRSFSKLTALHTGMSVENMLVMKIGLGWAGANISRRIPHRCIKKL